VKSRHSAATRLRLHRRSVQFFSTSARAAGRPARGVPAWLPSHLRPSKMLRFGRSGSPLRHLQATGRAGRNCIAVGIEDARPPGPRRRQWVGEALGYFSDRQSAVARPLCFHTLRGDMELYSRMVCNELISRDCDTGICERTDNPYAQMKVELTLEQATTIADQTVSHRCLPLKTTTVAITDGYAPYPCHRRGPCN